jgi:hypothetical protein
MIGTGWPCLSGAMAVAVSVLASTAQVRGADVTSVVQEVAIRALAEITAIQVRCRDLDVRPGYVFQYLEQTGVSVLDVMPGGRRRADFDAAFDVVTLVDTSQLCSTVAEQYEQTVPGAINPRR